jgi:hypothetical protein
LYNGGRLTVSNSTVSGNSGSGIYSGGGILNDSSGTLTVSNSTVSGNSGNSINGGGIYNAGTLTVTNSTLSGNSAGYGGGGIANTGTLTVSNSTVSGNSASHGGGFDTLYSRTVTVSNSIVAGNRAGVGPDLDGFSGSLGHNLIGNGTGGSGFDSTDRVGTASSPIDPLLGPLQDNGGRTQTMALQPGSPALNAGDPNQLGTADQRGVVRSRGVNIGSYQASATAFLVSAPEMVRSGVPFDVSVMAVDSFGQVAVGYTGYFTFSATDRDPGVILPADYPITLADGGSVTVRSGVTLITPGDQTLTVTDTPDNTLTGSATVTVGSPTSGADPFGLGPPPPTPLPANLAPAQPAPSSAPSDPELFAGDGWRASAPEGNYMWAPAFRLSHPVGGQPEAWLADPGPPEDQRGAGG